MPEVLVMWWSLDSPWEREMNHSARFLGRVERILPASGAGNMAEIMVPGIVRMTAPGTSLFGFIYRGCRPAFGECHGYIGRCPVVYNVSI